MFSVNCNLLWNWTWIFCFLNDYKNLISHILNQASVGCMPMTPIFALEISTPANPRISSLPSDSEFLYLCFSTNKLKSSLNVLESIKIQLLNSNSTKACFYPRKFIYRDNFFATCKELTIIAAGVLICEERINLHVTHRPQINLNLIHRRLSAWCLNLMPQLFPTDSIICSCARLALK